MCGIFGVVSDNKRGFSLDQATIHCFTGGLLKAGPLEMTKYECSKIYYWQAVV